jgi:hypothetical protein
MMAASFSLLHKNHIVFLFQGPVGYPGAPGATGATGSKVRIQRSSIPIRSIEIRDVWGTWMDKNLKETA